MNLKNQKIKLLLRSPNWVGDAIMATPVVKALKKNLPESSLHVLAKSWVAPIWNNLDEVSSVITMETYGRKGMGAWLKLVGRLRQERYDVVLILPRSFSTAWMAFWAAVPVRIGYQGEARGLLLSHALPWSVSLQQGPRPQSYLHLLSALGIKTDSDDGRIFAATPSMKATAAAEALLGPGTRTRVGIAPGSVAPSRRWPWERYARLVRLLQEQGVQVVLLGSGSDQLLAEQVAARAGGEVLITAGKTDLDTGLAVVRKMQLVISNDSGAMHMAYAQQVPVLVLQGAADPRVTGPFGSASAYLRNEQLSCAPCVKNECPLKNLACMTSLSVEEVWTKVQSMLGKLSK